MTERTSYAPGTPSWVDLGSPDPSAAAAFYGGLFGWTVVFDPRPEAGGYAICTLKDRPVAGLGQQTDTGVPPYWTVYVTVVDADASQARAVGHGGTVVVETMDVLDAGRMGILQDPGGAIVALWEPRAHPGAGLVDEPGTFVWAELATGGVMAARDFYSAVFDWGVDEPASSHTGAIFSIGGTPTSGAHAAGEGEVPSWTVWFAVADCDASAAAVRELGGSVLLPPSDMSFGRGALVADPHGAVFGIGTMGGRPHG